MATFLENLGAKLLYISTTKIETNMIPRLLDVSLLVIRLLKKVISVIALHLKNVNLR